MNPEIKSINLIALNKPKWYVVTKSDELGRKTVYQLLPQWVFDDGWMPIWRLDLESKGLLLFTKNGKISNLLTTPGNCKKIYEIWVRWFVTPQHIQMALDWVESPHGILKAKFVEKIWNGWAKTKLRVQLDEGKNRHIRRLFWAMKDPKFATPLKVLHLTRVSIWSLELSLESWKWDFITKQEENNLLWWLY